MKKKKTYECWIVIFSDGSGITLPTQKEAKDFRKTSGLKFARMKHLREVKK